MAEFRLTRQTQTDLENIVEYTLYTWGKKQCTRYLNELQTCFQEIAVQPGIGKNCDPIRPGLMRIEQGRHVVFYRQKPYGVRIIRVLHQSMLPERHLREMERG